MKTCGKHGVPLIWEEGGSDKPTILGRHYCPKCQDEFIKILDRAAKSGNDDVSNDALDGMDGSMARFAVRSRMAKAARKNKRPWWRRVVGK